MSKEYIHLRAKTMPVRFQLHPGIVDYYRRKFGLFYGAGCAKLLEDYFFEHASQAEIEAFVKPYEDEIINQIKNNHEVQS